MEKVKFTEKKYVAILSFVVSLFFLWAIAITMGDVLNKHFQSVLHISKFRSRLVQFSIFGAYAVMGIAAGLFMKKYGYKKGGGTRFVPVCTGGILVYPGSQPVFF
ncbi:MAG: hypothetical protein QM610_11930 [Chitinophagaceae bacterium]